MAPGTATLLGHAEKPANAAPPSRETAIFLGREGHEMIRREAGLRQMLDPALLAVPECVGEQRLARLGAGVLLRERNRLAVLRRERSRPIVDEIRAWLETRAPLPRSGLGRAAASATMPRLTLPRETGAGEPLLSIPPWRSRALRVLGETTWSLQSLGEHLDQLVAELHALGELRVGCVRNGPHGGGKSPSTKQ